MDPVLETIVREDELLRARLERARDAAARGRREAARDAAAARAERDRELRAEVDAAVAATLAEVEADVNRREAARARWLEEHQAAGGERLEAAIALYLAIVRDGEVP